MVRVELTWLKTRIGDAPGDMDDYNDFNDEYIDCPFSVDELADHIKWCNEEDAGRGVPLHVLIRQHRDTVASDGTLDREIDFTGNVTIDLSENLRKRPALSAQFAGVADGLVYVRIRRGDETLWVLADAGKVWKTLTEF